MAARWILLYDGVPPAGAFGNTRGEGSPIIVNANTSLAYYYNPVTGVQLLASSATPTTPAGATTQVQYNNAGSFGASANFNYDSGTNTVSFGSITGSALSMAIQLKAPTVLEDAGAIGLNARNAAKANSNGGGIGLQTGNGLGTGLPGRFLLSIGTSGVTLDVGADIITFIGPLNSLIQMFDGGFNFVGGTGPFASAILFQAAYKDDFSECGPIQFGTDSGLQLEITESPIGDPIAKLGSATGKVAFFAGAGAVQQTLPAAATDPATTMALVNAIRSALLAHTLCN